jgi:hypothetical protein
VDLLENVSSKEWELAKFLEPLESPEWEERTLEKERFKTFSSEWKKSLGANGTMRYFFQSNWCFNELGSMNSDAGSICSGSQDDDKQHEKHKSKRSYTHTAAIPSTGMSYYRITHDITTLLSGSEFVITP